MKHLSVKDAAGLLGVDSSRVRQLILGGRLPAQKIGNTYVISEEDLALVADRKWGRPAKKTDTADATAEASPVIEANAPDGGMPTAVMAKPAKKARKKGSNQ